MGKTVCVNEHFTERLSPEKTLVTTRHGGWALLSNSCMELLKKNTVAQDSKLHSLLEEQGIIVTTSNIERISKDLRSRYTFLSHPVGIHIIAPTLRCNFKCAYCHASSEPAGSSGFDMSPETSEKVIDFILGTPMDSLLVEFQGGEPLLNFGTIRHAVEYAREKAKEKNKSVHFRIQSNLSAMTDEIAEFLRAEKIQIGTSLDGPREVHNRTRVRADGSGTYDDVVGWINYLRDEYSIFVSALLTVTRHSLPHPKEIVDEYVRLGMPDIRLMPVLFTGRARDAWDSIGISGDEYFGFWKEVVDYLLAMNKSGGSMKELTASRLAGNILTPPNDYMCIRRPCGFGISQLAYNYDGAIYGCDQFKRNDLFRLGDAHKSTYQDVQAHPATLAARNITGCTIPGCENCAFNPYCGGCVSDFFNNYDNILPKIPTYGFCKFYKKAFRYIFGKLVDREEGGILLGWAKNGAPRPSR